MNLFGEPDPEPVKKDKKAVTKRTFMDPMTKPRVPPAPIRSSVEKKRRVPVKDRPGTKMSTKAWPLRANRGGEMRFIGTVDPVNRVYQRGIDLKHHVLPSTGEMMFGYTDEWKKIQSEVRRLEHIDISSPTNEGFRLFSIPLSEARRLGRLADTAMGQRWAVPLDAFDIEKTDGTIERPGKR